MKTLGKSEIREVGLRDLYATEALPYIPRILELMDRNPTSPTYSCFDRAFWHYRTTDFPSGMYAECVLPLALVYEHELPGNRFFKKERIREFAIAGIEFARRSSHADGSCDDYYPFEKALGAAAFSLYAMSEACLILDLKEEKFRQFFCKRGEWIMRSKESGRLSNHQALAALALQNVFLLTQEKRFAQGAQEILSKVLLWQHEEGWFPEYEGCDPGYLTFTIDFLAKYFQKTGDEKLLGPLQKAVEFASFWMHPDGTFGGEYGSRNTFHFLPHGFELLGRWLPLAIELNDCFLWGIQQENRPLLDDDRVFSHYVYNFLQAYLDFCPARSEEKNQVDRVDRWFPGAGLYVKKEGNCAIYVSTKKGGVFKFYEEDELLATDTGLAGKLKTGERFVSQVISDWRVQRDDKELTVQGSLYRWNPRTFVPLTFVLFRLFLIGLGRFFPDWIRRFAQRKLILEKKPIGIRLTRRFSFQRAWTVEDEIQLEDSRIEIEELFVGTDSTSIYVATSQPYQRGVLKEWVNLNSRVPEANRERSLTWARVLR